MTFLLLSLILLVPLCLGAALLRRGWRGVVIDEHPLCRRCGFDLTGKPSDSDRCAECGADVSAPKSIRRGHRRRRTGQLLLGVTLLVIVLGTVAGVVTYVLRTTDLNTIKPVWWLVLDAESRDRATNSAALNELSRRVKYGDLSGNTLLKLVNKALVHQADPGYAWVNEWGDFIEGARQAGGVVIDEQWALYARRALEGAGQLRVRRNVRRGDPIPWSVAFGGPDWRGGNGLVAMLSYDTRRSISVAPVFELRERDTGHQTFTSAGNGVRSISDLLTLDAAQLAKLSDGPQKLACVVHVDVRDFRNQQDGPVLDGFDVPLEASWTLLPADQLTAAAKHAPELTAAIRAALRVQAVHLSHDGSSTRLSVDFYVGRAPAALAFEVIAREPTRGREFKFHSIAQPIGAGCAFGIRQDAPADFARAIADSKAVDIIFRPSAMAAVRSVDLTEYWTGDEPIVFEHVPVKVEQPPP